MDEQVRRRISEKPKNPHRPPRQTRTVFVAALRLKRPNQTRPHEGGQDARSRVHPYRIQKNIYAIAVGKTQHEHHPHGRQ